MVVDDIRNVVVRFFHIRAELFDNALTTVNMLTNKSTITGSKAAFEDAIT